MRVLIWFRPRLSPHPNHHSHSFSHFPSYRLPSLSHQVAEGSYDFEANKTLLKLYLLYPPLANQEKVETVRCVTSRVVHEKGKRSRGSEDW